jgi:hypothetical protein
MKQEFFTQTSIQMQEMVYIKYLTRIHSNELSKIKISIQAKKSMISKL